MLKLLLIGLGGFAGALARYGLSAWLNSITGIFPLGTVLVNVAGCGLFGIGLGLVEREAGFNEQLQALVFVGVLGAFTTFSTFSYETLQLLRMENVAGALAYTLVSVAAGLLALWLGYAGFKP